jgi:beta-phosphoglucomutase
VDRGVIFDMDGVLVDSGPAHRESWEKVAGELHRTITKEQFDATFGRPSRDIIRALFGDLSAEEVKAIDDRKESLYRSIVERAMPIMPGAIELVRALHDAGFLLAIGSSGPPENIALVIRALGIGPAISAIVNGFDVSHGKPHPEVFLRATEKLGLPPARCVVIEDAPSGIEAAHRGGMKVVALASSHPRTELAAADLIIDRLDALDARAIASLLDAPAAH